MRIALLAPITHAVPPTGYGPWERVVADLARGLVREGHDVTVFAAGGSQVGARVVATTPAPLDDWRYDQVADPRIWEEIHIAELARQARAGTFDLVHNHLHVHALGYAEHLPCPMVTTLHGVGWNQAVHPALDRYSHLPFVSISDAERRFYPGLDYVATVYNGVDSGAFPYGDGDGDYLLFAGRMSPEKAPHRALEVAVRAGRRLLLAGPVEEQHQDYFETRVAPLLDSDRINLGPVDSGRMGELYRGAEALLMPLDWDEPFGLVVGEALMSGTPVVAWRRGAMPELIEDGTTGFVVGAIEEAVEALARLDRLDRKQCRQAAEARFDLRVMTAGYVAVYSRLVAGSNGSE